MLVVVVWGCRFDGAGCVPWIVTVVPVEGGALLTGLVSLDGTVFGSSTC
jgi:hypothetical protein